MDRWFSTTAATAFRRRRRCRSSRLRSMFAACKTGSGKPEGGNCRDEPGCSLRHFHDTTLAAPTCSGRFFPIDHVCKRLRPRLFQRQGMRPSGLPAHKQAAKYFAQGIELGNAVADHDVAFGWPLLDRPRARRTPDCGRRRGRDTEQSARAPSERAIREPGALQSSELARPVTAIILPSDDSDRDVQQKLIEPRCRAPVEAAGAVQAGADELDYFRGSHELGMAARAGVPQSRTGR